MAKTKGKHTNGMLTAATYSTNGKRGKPSRPEGMPNEEWFKVMVNARVPKMLKSMRGVSRLASMSGFDPAIGARIIADIKGNLSIMREAFENPKVKRTVKNTEKYVI
jgi:hypothetical protein